MWDVGGGLGGLTMMQGVRFVVGVFSTEVTGQGGLPSRRTSGIDMHSA